MNQITVICRFAVQWHHRSGTDFDVNLSADFPISEWEPDKVTPTTTENVFEFRIIPENLTISGRTIYNNVSQGHTALWFTGISDSAMNHTSASDAEGNYSVELSYGRYDVYARKVSGSNVYVYLGVFRTVPPIPVSDSSNAASIISSPEDAPFCMTTKTQSIPRLSIVSNRAPT